MESSSEQEESINERDGDDALLVEEADSDTDTELDGSNEFDESDGGYLEEADQAMPDADIIQEMADKQPSQVEESISKFTAATKANDVSEDDDSFDLREEEDSSSDSSSE